MAIPARPILLNYSIICTFLYVNLKKYQFPQMRDLSSILMIYFFRKKNKQHAKNNNNVFYWLQKKNKKKKPKIMQSRLVHCKLKYTWNMKHELGNGNIVNYSRFGLKICNYVRYYYAHCMYTIYNLDDLVGNKGVQINTVSMHTFINLLNIYSLASNSILCFNLHPIFFLFRI